LHKADHVSVRIGHRRDQLAATDILHRGAKIAYGVDQLKVVFDFTVVDGIVTAIELLADAAVLAELDVELLPSAR